MGLDAVFDYIIKFIRVLRINDIIDIFIVAIAVYYFMNAIRGTRAVQLVKGILVIVAVYMTSSILRLHTLNYILSALVQVAMFGVIVIFQPELRTLLEKMGRLKVGHFLGIAADPFGEKRITETVIESVSRAAAEMSQSRTGALIVIERHTRLGEYMNSGTLMNADVSSELLGNIFVPSTPLHDGAVIIRDNKIITAGCVLPLTANTNLASELGTRHRAALGLSEASDAVIVVVSEETGKISIAINGSLTRNLTEQSLKKALTKLLTVTETADIETVKKIFRKNR
ncbi:MAG: diadenylate cyclase CdaA [Clostridia bacterium]|nr:diadenylate cyclase CdaA [Clostridia bacterium]